jgi:hypothetical protein
MCHINGLIKIEKKKKMFNLPPQKKKVTSKFLFVDRHPFFWAMFFLIVMIEFL